MSGLGLNEHHSSEVINYMRFARYQKGQRLRTIDACFEDLKNSRLYEDTYTQDEVVEMLDGLLSMVRGEVDDELLNTSHTNILLLRQLFQQAEKWHLKLQADISELENRDLLESIKDFEEAEFSGASKKENSALSSKLAPLNESGTSALLTVRINELVEENDRLKARLGSVEKTASNVSEERSVMMRKLQQKEAELASAMNRKMGYDSEEVDQLQSQLGQLKMSMEGDVRSAKNAASAMESSLVDSKHELLRVQEMLELAEKELEKKVNQTAPFKNLKSMLTKKNDQLKDLRKRLARYEDSDD